MYKEFQIKPNRRISKLMRVQCTQCGACCRKPVVEVTHYDVLRLSKFTSIPPPRIIKFYRPDEIEEDGEDRSEWIRLSYGMRFMGLRKRNGRCIFLSKEKKCTVYPVRPLTCRIFPLSVVIDEEKGCVDGLDLSDIVIDRFIRCRHRYGEERPLKEFIRDAVQAMRETNSYSKKIKKWNTMPQKGNSSAFLQFLGL